MATAKSYISGNRDGRQSLVVIFLRGGADGLSLVAPVKDDEYHKARPRIAVSKDDAVQLDDFFGLYPLLKELGPIYKDGTLAIVHAVGSEDNTRSHFDAQDLMEHGGIVAGGWLGRFLRSRTGSTSSELAAVAVGKELPECLRGAPSATVLQSLDEFSWPASGSMARELERLYAAEQDALGQAARNTFDALRRIESLRSTPYRPEHGAEYENDDFARGLMQVARLIKARVGLEAASIDLGGWDSHFVQQSIMDPLTVRLSKGLAAFHRDMGREMDTTTVVVMTEFGRRVSENASFGTDHGRGSVMFVLGGGIHGGRVLGRWPSLKSDSLEGPGDLPVTTNYRNVLASILARGGAGEQLDAIFPGFSIDPVALYA